GRVPGDEACRRVGHEDLTFGPALRRVAGRTERREVVDAEVVRHSFGVAPRHEKTETEQSRPVQRARSDVLPREFVVAGVNGRRGLACTAPVDRLAAGR